MKKFLFLFGLLAVFSVSAYADPITYSYSRVTRTATAVSANTWTQLNGTVYQGNFDPTCKHIKISEDTRNFDIYVAFTSQDINTSTAWLQKASDGVFDEPMSLDPNYGVYVYVSGTCTVRLKTEK